MYSVAEDYPKQMAQIMAEYEARAGNPRYNPFGESPDSPRRLEQELTEPFRAVFAASQPQTRALPNRYFETGGDIIQIDQRTGRPTTVYDSPERNGVDEAKRKIKASLLQDEIKELQRAKLTSPADRPGITDEVIDTRLADKTMQLESLFAPTAATQTATAPTPQPRMAFGGLGSELAPILGAGSTNAPVAPTSKYKRISYK